MHYGIKYVQSVHYLHNICIQSRQGGDYRSLAFSCTVDPHCTGQCGHLAGNLQIPCLLSLVCGGSAQQPTDFVTADLIAASQSQING